MQAIGGSRTSRPGRTSPVLTRPDVQAEIVRINTEARPIALQVALLVPLLAGLLGLAVSFGMLRQKDVEPSAAVEGMVLG